jgi:hypothetical protein
MDPNAKLVFEEFVKQFREEIHDSFTVHESIVNNCLSEFEQAGQRCEERVASLKSITVSFEEWKPGFGVSFKFFSADKWDPLGSDSVAACRAPIGRPGWRPLSRI